MSQTDKIRNLLTQRKEARVAQRILYQQGALNAEEYYQNISRLEDQIISAVEELRHKLLSNMDGSILNS